MSCYHPLKAFPVGKTEKGKIDYKITGIDAECVALNGDKWDPYPYVLDIPNCKVVTDSILIPCGQCIGCRLDYSREWAVRMMAELNYHDSAYFVTLTYNDDNLPMSEYVDDDGVIQSIATLCKRDCQLFFKRLRKDQEVRYYLAGEYGPTTARPHYHAIIYGLELNDLIYYKDTDLGFSLYTSPYLAKKWQKGHVIVGNVSFESCAYVSRYICSKLKGDLSELYDRYNLTPEFSLMSRRPGIGKDYFLDHFDDIYPRDEIILDKGQVVRPPRYYDKCMDSIDDNILQSVKDVRVDVANNIQFAKMQLTDVSYKELLRAEELNKKFKLKKLSRKI